MAMRWSGLAALLVAAFVSRAGAAVLFATADDFSTFTAQTGFTVASSTTFDADGQTVNGVGNYTAGAGTAGSLQVTRTTAGTFSGIGFSNQNESANQTFLAAIDPGATATTYPPPTYSQVPGSTVAYSGNLYLTYTVPTNNGGNYFNVGVILNYNGNYGMFTQTSAAVSSVGGTNTYTATIPYTINAVSGLSYFQLGLLYNSDYNATTPFYVDSITTTPTPEPASLSALAIGAIAVMRRRRRA